ncbi:MAG TPA: type II secretion system protein GspC [Thiothrix sp.]|nr:type II secretion system protein GspC [Thiothrix sp.]
METWFHHPHLQRTLRALPSIATGLLTILLAIMLATLFWQIFTPAKTLPSMLPVKAIMQANVAQGEPINYGNVIANHHLFGQEQQKTVTKVLVNKPAVVSQTRLSLVLVGIFDRPSKKSYAIIASQKGGKQAFYGVGDEPQTGVVIESISAKKIMLKHNGRLEELRLPEGKLNIAKNSPPSRRNNNVSLPKALPPINPRLPSDELNLPQADELPDASSPKSPKGNKNGSSSEDLSLLRDAVMNNPDKLLEIASVTESKDKEGNLRGFRLSPGKNRALFRQLGLRPGDVVTSVNGIQLDSPAKGISVMSELQGAESINLTVLRGGQEVSISKSF